MNNKIASKGVLIATVLVIALLSWSPEINNIANSQVDSGLKRSLVSFAVARAISAVTSVFQGTELVLEPLGFGVILSIGQILEPIKDLADQFAHFMLVASVAFGVQKLLLTIASHWVVNAFVTALAFGWAICYWLNKAPSVLSRLLVVVLFIRFVMPVATIGSAFVFDTFSSREYEASLLSLQNAAERLNGLSKEGLTATSKGKPEAALSPTLTPPAAPSVSKTAPLSEKKDILSRIVGDAKEGLSGAVNALTSVKERAAAALDATAEGLRTKYEFIKSVAETIVDLMIAQIVIFLMQTIIVPLILLFVLYRLLTGLISRGRSAPI